MALLRSALARLSESPPELGGLSEPRPSWVTINATWMSQLGMFGEAAVELDGVLALPDGELALERGFDDGGTVSPMSWVLVWADLATGRRGLRLAGGTIGLIGSLTLLGVS